MQIFKQELENISLPVKRGQVNRSVKKVQEWLVFNGFDPKGIDSDFGPGCEAAVRLFQRKSSLPETGIVDKITWDKLSKELKMAIEFIPSGKKLSEAIIEVAKAHLTPHPVEIGGDNRGPWVRHYCKGADGPTYAWCQGFASTIVEQACEALKVKSPIPLYDANNYMSLWVPWVVQSAKTVGRFSTTPSIGGFFFVKGGQYGHFHVGIVTERISATEFRTIEGNTNDEKSAQGYEVCANIRKINTCDFGVI